jgi:hypothetical protein
MRFKVGDYVSYKKHYTAFDNELFEISKVYKISQIKMNSSDDLLHEILLEDISNYFVYSTQITKAFHANKLNKVLYPDYKIITVDNKEFLVENTNDGGNE